MCHYKVIIAEFNYFGVAGKVEPLLVNMMRNVSNQTRDGRNDAWSYLFVTYAHFRPLDFLLPSPFPLHFSRSYHSFFPCHLLPFLFPLPVHDSWRSSPTKQSSPHWTSGIPSPCPRCVLEPKPIVRSPPECTLHSSTVLSPSLDEWYSLYFSQVRPGARTHCKSTVLSRYVQNCSNHRCVASCTRCSHRTHRPTYTLL